MIRDEAEKLIKHGVIAACVSGAVSLVLVLYAISSNAQSGVVGHLNDPLAFLDVGLIFLLTFGVYRKSRTAAVLLVVYVIVSKAIMAVDTGRVAGIGVTLVFLYFYVNAIRGTFAFHKIEKAENPRYEVRKAGPIAGGLIAFAFGAGAVLYLLGELGVTPSANVLTGDQVGSKTIELLRGHGVLYDDEEVELFFSEGLTSVLEGGTVLSDRAVIAYVRNDRGELDVFELEFHQIRSVVLEQQGGTFSLSVHRAHGDDDAWIDLHLPHERGQDKHFVEAIHKRTSR